MSVENVNELIESVARRCFNGTLPGGSPENIALAIVEVCLADETADNLTNLMTMLVPAIERKMAAQRMNAQRLAELDAEIISLRGRIRRSNQDESMLRRIRPESSEREAELSQIRDERARVESALFNLVKERHELRNSKCQS